MESLDSLNNNTLVAVFDMINDRLYKLEQNNEKLLSYAKINCVSKKRLYCRLFDYPKDVCLVRHTTIDFNKGSFIFLMDGECFEPPYRIYDNVDCGNIKDVLKNILDEKQYNVVEKYIEDELNDTKNEILKCKDAGIRSWSKYIDDFILTQYVKTRFPKIRFLSTDLHFMVLKDVGNVDEAIHILVDVRKFLNVPINNENTDRFKEEDCISVDEVLPSWMPFYLIHHREADLFDFSVFNCTERIFVQYVRFLRRIDENHAQSSEDFDTNYIRKHLCNYFPHFNHLM